MLTTHLSDWDSDGAIILIKSPKIYKIASTVTFVIRSG